jgi:hypothetical protein
MVFKPHSFLNHCIKTPAGGLPEYSQFIINKLFTMRNFNCPISVQLDETTYTRIENIKAAIISNREKVLKGLRQSETRYSTIYESILKDFNVIIYRASHGMFSIAFYDLMLCEEKSDLLFRHLSLLQTSEAQQACQSVYSMFSLFRSLRKDLFCEE